MVCHEVHLNENSGIQNQIDSIKHIDIAETVGTSANLTSNQGRLNCFHVNNIRPPMVYILKVTVVQTITRSRTHPNKNNFLKSSAKHAIFYSNVKQ